MLNFIFLQSYYYLERKKAAPMGKLYNKYRNWKSDFARKTSTAKRPREKLFEMTEGEDAHVRALKHDLAAMTYQEKIEHWNACAATRMNAIHETENSPKQINDMWPQYKMPDGYRLVEADFVYLHGERNGLVDGVNEFSSLMLEKVFPMRLKSFGGEDNELMKRAEEKKHELSPGISIFSLCDYFKCYYILNQYQ